MERRVLVGGFTTALAVVGVVLGSFLLGRDLVAAVLFAALPGGVVAGLCSRESGHVGSGARAGAYGGIVAFLGFVIVGAVQTVLGGDFSILFLGVQTVLVALLVVPIHAAIGAVGAVVGVRIRNAMGLETAL
ncbi:hypothetical protein KY092_15910 [Natronomonas gomsonensis]|uniref:hypothetical protein n=1 Tax=Natronomonas gomsonensis TaxID=1046043 RepID=UPI0020CA7D3C|nr:hypothetical protein [Natronomonas gomsonensis]MCY4732047.1 hypothetical protein [Natronomonas gomsonensis]